MIHTLQSLEYNFISYTYQAHRPKPPKGNTTVQNSSLFLFLFQLFISWRLKMKWRTDRTRAFYILSLHYAELKIPWPW
jgi:hypothetical protein